MTISKLGTYELPLSSEERATIISYLAGLVRTEITDAVRMRLQHSLHAICAIRVPSFKDIEWGKIEADIAARLTLVQGKIVNDFPAATDFANPDRWAFSLQPMKENTPPKVLLNEPLYSFLMGGNDIKVDLSKIPDEKWIEYAERYKGVYPNLIAITPEMKIYIELNDKLNDLVINADYRDDHHDFTDIIEEIAKAAKEGKL